MLATCPVPWTAQGELDATLFQKTVADQAAGLTSHLYVFGTAGEGYAVTDAQFRQVVNAFCAALPAKAAPMVGLISLSLGTVIERIAWTRAQGIRDFQLSLPAWGALGDREVNAFFDETCGRLVPSRASWRMTSTTTRT